MQGKKDYQEKLFAQFQPSERIPKANFYRQLKAVLDLDFLYGLTKTVKSDDQSVRHVILQLKEVFRIEINPIMDFNF